MKTQVYDLIGLTKQKYGHLPKHDWVLMLFQESFNRNLLKIGDKVPSINELSAEFDLSRDTIEKAYKTLRSKGVLTPQKGKGYFVSAVKLSNQLRILFVINKMSAHKKSIISAFSNYLNQHLDTEPIIDLRIYHGSPEQFQSILTKEKGNFDAYLLIPHFLGKAFDDIPSKTLLTMEKYDNLLIVDHLPEAIENRFPAICQNFEEDIYNLICSDCSKFRTYDKISLVIPSYSFHPLTIKKGFVKACRKNNLNYTVETELNRESIQKNTLYLLVEEADLVELLKICQQKQWVLGKDLGILSYNDTPLKELLFNGISVISTDFDEMGVMAAKWVLDPEQRKGKHYVNFYKKYRSSF